MIYLNFIPPSPWKSKHINGKCFDFVCTRTQRCVYFICSKEVARGQFSNRGLLTGSITRS